MFVILEGVDGSGKSTLAAEVKSQIEQQALGQVELRHCGPLKRDPLDEYALDVEDYRPGGPEHVVADRWHLGERIYGPLYRGKSQVDTAKWRWLELFLMSRGAVTFVLDPDLDLLQRRLSERGEDFLKAWDVLRVVETYRELTHVTPTLGSLISVSGDLGSFTAQEIVDTATMADSQTWLLQRFPSYIGGPFPGVLLLGDKRNLNSGVVRTRSAFLPVNGNSGTFLLESLPDHLWSAVGLANSAEENVRELHHSLRQPDVVTLGRRAHEIAVKNDVPHAALPHPQYVRRFYYSEQEKYGQMIQELAGTEKELLSWPK